MRISYSAIFFRCPALPATGPKASIRTKPANVPAKSLSRAMPLPDPLQTLCGREPAAGPNRRRIFRFRTDDRRNRRAIREQSPFCGLAPAFERNSRSDTNGSPRTKRRLRSPSPGRRKNSMRYRSALTFGRENAGSSPNRKGPPPNRACSRTSGRMPAGTAPEPRPSDPRTGHEVLFLPAIPDLWL